MSGYARFHRSLIGHPAFRNDAEAMAFAYMVLRAAWRPVRVRYKGRGIMLNRGQLSMSQRDMAAALDRDKAWIERLWKRLRDEAMIHVVTEAGAAIITICNYDKYQHSNDDGEAAGEAPREADARQTRGTEQVREEYKKEEDDASHHCARAPAQPLSEAVNDWNEAARSAGWPTVSKFNPARQAALRSRLKQDGIEGWRMAIRVAEASPYLAGAPPPQWFNFDWLVKPTNFAKVIDGNYANARPAHHDTGGRASNASHDRPSGWATRNRAGSLEPASLDD